MKQSITLSDLKLILFDIFAMKYALRFTEGSRNHLMERSIEMGYNAERSFIDIGYFDENGEYKESTNPIFLEAHIWYETIFARELQD